MTAPQHHQLTSPQPVDAASPAGSAVSNNRFSRLHLAAASPDWMLSLSKTQARSSASTVPVTSASASKASALSAPVPLGGPAPVTTTATTATATTSTRGAGSGFLSMFYRSPAAVDTPASKVPQPPAAIGGTATPPLRPMALPVDVSLSVDAAATGRPQTAEVRLASPMRPREAPRAGPMAIGSDTWNALGSPALPRAKAVRVGFGAASASRNLVAPASIDAAPMPVAAPQPLWSELPAAKQGMQPPTPGTHRVQPPEPLGAPTLEAFRSTKRGPEPPRPITTSPLREADEAAPAAAPAPPLVPTGASSRLGDRPRTMATVRALRPVGEDDAPLTPVRKPAETARGGFFRGAQVRPQAVAKTGGAVNPFAGLTFATMLNNDSDSNSDDEGPMLPSDVTNLNAELSRQEEAQKSANAQNFLNTLFSVAPSPFGRKDTVEHKDSVSPIQPPQMQPTTTVSNKSATDRLVDALMNFSAIDLAIGGGSSSASSNTTKRKEASHASALGAPGSLPASHTQRATDNVDYSSYFSTDFDAFEDEGEESLDHLKHVVSIVMQSAKQQQQAEEASAAAGGVRTTHSKNSGSNDGYGRGGGGGGGGGSMFTVYTGNAANGGLRDSGASSSEWKVPHGTTLFQGM